MDASVPIFQQRLEPLGLDVAPAGECGFEELAAAYRLRLEPEKGPVHVAGMTTMAECRAALLAVKKLDCGAPWVSWVCDEGGESPTRVHMLAALFVCEGMGAAAFGIDCPEEAAQERMAELAAYGEADAVAARRGGEAAEVAAVAVDKVKGRFIKHDINFLGHRRLFLTVAAVAMALCFIVVGVRGLNFGIEFVGGTSVAFHDTGDVATEQVRQAFDAAGEPDAVIQTTATNGEPGFLVRTTTTSAEDATATANQVADEFGWPTTSFEVTTIGPDWGASVIQSSLLAFFVSIILIIIYIAIRFEYKMGVMAIVALLHDLILVMGIYALVGREVNPNTIAALLTILGYSLYDTVVVFHRINDNMKGSDIKCTFMTMANHSVNQVFVRTINTTLTSFVPVLAMLLFGGETLKDFAFAMVIGLLAGSYSSIAIATPLYAMWKTREPRYAKLQQKYGTKVGLFEFDHAGSAAIEQVPLSRLAAEAKATPAEAAAAAEPTGGKAAAKPAPKPEKAKGSAPAKPKKPSDPNMRPASAKRPAKPKKPKASQADAPGSDE